MPDTVRIVIYDSVITAMNQPGGTVWRWAHQKSQRVATLARANCPKRSGELRASIFSEVEASSRNETHMAVSANTDYAAYVHEGTFPYGPTRPVAVRTQPYMRLPPYGRHGWKSKLIVDGQKGQPFLRDALEDIIGTL